MLILSSYGFGAPIVEEIYRKHIKTDGKVLIVPFAGLDFGATVKYEKEFLKRFGFEEKNIYACGFNNTEEIKNIPFQYIYTCAGDTFKLLDALKKNNLINFIKNLIDCGATYIGVSAGAYVCTSDIKYVTCLEDNNCITDDFSALGLIENVICHSDQYSYQSMAECKDFAQDKEFIYIRNDEVVVLENK